MFFACVYMEEERLPYIREGLYIDMNMLGGNINARYNCSDRGAIIVTLYKSLDKEHGSPPVEHVVELGSFKIENLESKSASDFLSEIRKGIMKKIDF